MPDVAAYSPTQTLVLTSRARLLSLLEVALGIFIVIGHNVFHIFPNEVPILFILFWVSGFLRGKPWKFGGLGRPKSWRKTVALAIAAAAVLQLGSELVIQPIAVHL